jgi:hypothetical protein
MFCLAFPFQFLLFNNHNYSPLTVLLALSLVALPGYVARFTTHKASKVRLVPLLLTINVLFGFPLLVHVVLITTTRLALYHVCIRDAFLRNRATHILGSCLFINIKRGDQTFNSHGLLLVLQAHGEILPRWTKFGNNATNHEPVRQDIIKVRKFPH